MDLSHTTGWLEEIQEQEFNDDAFGACSTNTFSLSDYYGNEGWFCTLTQECMAVCAAPPQQTL